MFTATRVQVATYLLGVCPFSIAFLVFLNSSVSFVITDLIGQENGVGDAVGNLGFADELLALLACPLWGLLSDRIGVRYVCVLGYLIIALALIVFVQCKNVYPQLLFGRLLFSLGGAAASTMVTAILPCMSFVPPAGPAAQALRLPVEHSNGNHHHRQHAANGSIISDLTITPERYHSETAQSNEPSPSSTSTASPTRDISKIAGYVGMFTGCGALLALALFLPLPARFQRSGITPAHALQFSYYFVSGIAFALAIVCFFGFMQLQGDNVAVPPEHAPKTTLTSPPTKTMLLSQLKNYIHPLYSPLRAAFLAGLTHSDIGIGYLGGFVARASSVAISLFIPLLVNATFLDEGLCSPRSSPPTTYPPASASAFLYSRTQQAGTPGGGDIQRRCPRAYVVAAQLTGASQLIALLCAPLFGYAAARAKVRNLPLMIACGAGVVGYPLFAARFSPDDAETGDRVVAFFAVGLIGVSQIGAIVCSLGTLSRGVLEANENTAAGEGLGEVDERREAVVGVGNGEALAAHREEDGEAGEGEDEAAGLLSSEPDPNAKSTTPLRGVKAFSSLKGSIAGVYSFYGGAAILLLTKAGGSMFDNASHGAPFYIMAVFNGVLLSACASIGLARRYDRYRYQTYS